MKHEVCMYYLDDVDHNRMAAHLTRNDWKVLRSPIISNVVDGTDEDVLWNVSVRKMKALTVKMESVTVTGNSG
jgi:hypothetical protein